VQAGGQQQQQQQQANLCTSCMPISSQLQQQIEDEKRSADPSAATSAAVCQGGGTGGEQLVPAGCAPGPGLPHNPYYAGPPLPPCDEERCDCACMCRGSPGGGLWARLLNNFLWGGGCRLGCWWVCGRVWAYAGPIPTATCGNGS
jgi:hypothetical protein